MEPLKSPVDAAGWFAESEVMWPGQKFALQCDTSVGERGVLHHARSEFQEVLVLQTKEYGRCLVLDGVIQLTERDEFAYQEMITHLPLFAHANPTSVLIVGGGDGGVLREVVRHAGVRRIVMCEIDRAVIEVSQKFFPETMATAFGDARLELVHDDAAEFVKRHRAAFDVVIVDSSDPVGPAESLFEPAFYASLRDALRPARRRVHAGRVRVAPPAAHLDRRDGVRPPLPDRRVRVHDRALVPVRPDRLRALLAPDRAGALRAPRAARAAAAQRALRYEDLHAAAFVLPQFARARARHRARAGRLPPRRLSRRAAPRRRGARRRARGARDRSAAHRAMAPRVSAGGGPCLVPIAAARAERMPRLHGRAWRPAFHLSC